ncbi:hypothetical protein O1O06_14075 [Grimontia hollisae]|uniref:hypothetical protein n=1 Tax=Grimontia hollisae TaxID=673 RepID=UPI0013035F07|nr:hypothetical protein [Grimontia hollisae]MDF2185877.1 hypothetical protein [Grimontia hollisae]
MNTYSDNYLNNAIARESNRIDEANARDEALDAYIEEGKQTLLAHDEFAGLTISQFTTYYFADFMDGRCADHLVSLTGSLKSNSRTHTFLNLETHLAFIDKAFEEFFTQNMSTITAAFDAELKAA